MSKICYQKNLEALLTTQSQKFIKKHDRLILKHLGRPLTKQEISAKNADTRRMALCMVGNILHIKLENGMMSSKDIKEAMILLYTNRNGELLSCFNGNPTNKTSFCKEVDTAIQQSSPASAQYHFKGKNIVQKPNEPLFFSKTLTDINQSKNWSRTAGDKPRGRHWSFNTMFLKEKDFGVGEQYKAIPHRIVILQARDSNRYSDEVTRTNKERTVSTPRHIDQNMILNNSAKLNSF